MKGSGDSAFTLFTIAFMLICVSILMYVITNDQIKRSEIIFSDSDLMSAKNTYFLINRSLGFTWHVSSVQSVFRTHDESIGCGFDDTDEAEPDDRLPPLYWYKYDPTKEKTSKELQRLPTTPNIKYNFKESAAFVHNPAICYPKQEQDINGNNFEYHILEYTKEKFSSYLKIPQEFKLSGMTIKVQNPQLELVIFNEEQKGMEFTTKQKVSLKSSLTEINSDLGHVSMVFTELDKIVEASRQIVLNVFIKTSDSLVREKGEPLFSSAAIFPPPSFPFDMSKRYLDSASAAINLQPTQSKDKYLEKFRTEIEDEINKIVAQSGFTTATHKTEIKTELFASHKPGDARFGAQCVNNLCIDINGKPTAIACSADKGCGEYTQLIVHYAVEISFSENMQTPYYYHNNYQNTFAPRDFSLELKAEDYLPAIDCQDSPYGDFDKNNPNTYPSILRKYNWEGSGDVICYCRKLWACETFVPGLPNSNFISDSQQISSDESCRTTLQFLDGNDIFCENGEFVVK